jgi:hypothetical protein
VAEAMASNDSVDDQELLDELDDLVKISDEKERKSAEIGRKLDESLDEEDQDLLDRLNRLDVVGASLAGDSKRPRIEGKIPEQMFSPLT